MKNIAYININSLIYNAKQIRLKLQNKKFYAVVKADAYGHGAERVANELYNYVDGYCVALLEEGVSLRQSGIDKPILLLISPICFNDYFDAVKYDLTVSVYNINQIKKLQKCANVLEKTANVHIKIDTGMNRLGLKSQNELINIMEYCNKNSGVKITGIYSHHYNAENDIERIKQNNKFINYVKIAKRYNKNITAHISSSGGFIKGDNFDLVRIGLLLYGYTPFKCNNVKLKPVMKVYAPILQQENLIKGEHILYGDKVVNEDCKVLVYRFGYADGLPRTNKSHFANRCMDISATKSRGELYKIPILYKNAVQLAKKYGTIPYEILVSVSKRCNKVYVK